MPDIFDSVRRQYNLAPGDMPDEVCPPDKLSAHVLFFPGFPVHRYCLECVPG